MEKQQELKKRSKLPTGCAVAGVWVIIILFLSVFIAIGVVLDRWLFLNWF